MSNINFDAMLEKEGNLLINLSSPICGIVKIIQCDNLDIDQIIDVLEHEESTNIDLKSPMCGLLDTLENKTDFMVNSIRSNIAYIHGVINIVNTLENKLIQLTCEVAQGRLSSTDNTFVKLVNLRKLMDTELNECLDMINNNERFYPSIKELLQRK